MWPNSVIALLVVLGGAVLAALPLILVERRWRWRWREVEIGRVPSLSGEVIPFREVASLPQFMRGAPRLVIITAYTCFVFGQMFIPGLLMGAFGLVAGGIGLVSIPGLITSAKIYSTGLALLRRAPRDAYFKARNAAAWALWLNGIIAGCSLILAITPWRPEHAAGWLFLAFINTYGLLSFLQAWLMLHTSRKYEDALFAPTSQVQLGRRTYPLAVAA